MRRSCWVRASSIRMRFADQPLMRRLRRSPPALTLGTSLPAAPSPCVLVKLNPSWQARSRGAGRDQAPALVDSEMHELSQPCTEAFSERTMVSSASEKTHRCLRAATALSRGNKRQRRHAESDIQQIAGYTEKAQDAHHQGKAANTKRNEPQVRALGARDDHRRL